MNADFPTLAEPCRKGEIKLLDLPTYSKAIQKLLKSMDSKLLRPGTFKWQQYISPGIQISIMLKQRNEKGNNNHDDKNKN